MQPLSKTDFTTLANFRSSPAISIFIPTHRAGVEVNEMQDAQLFKSLLQETRKKLEEAGMKKGEVADLVRGGAALLDDDDFWRYQQQGLGVFMGKDFFFTVKMPDPVNQELFIAPHFLVIPLFPLLKSKPFFLLVLSKGNARFFKGDRFEMEEMQVKGLPNGINDVIHFEEKGGKETFRRGGNKGKAAFHGHGAGLADEDEYLSLYLKEVDQTLLAEVLAAEKAPLLLAGAEGMINRYRQESDYPHVATLSLPGNHEHENNSSLFEKVTAVLQPYFDEDTESALKNYYNQSATPLSTMDPFKVFAGCFYGKVSDLFLDGTLHIRGTFNRETGQANFNEHPDMHTDCLINQGAVQVWLANGSVHVLEKERMPEGSKVAAFMRYA